MSRKPSSKHKIQADSVREFEIALEDEAQRLYARGYRNYETGKDWLKPGVLLNWVLAAYLRMEPDERERFAAIVGRQEFDRLLASDQVLYYPIEQPVSPSIPAGDATLRRIPGIGLSADRDRVDDVHGHREDQVPKGPRKPKRRP